jgi:hypothetical protein
MILPPSAGSGSVIFPSDGAAAPMAAAGITGRKQFRYFFFFM